MLTAILPGQAIVALKQARARAMTMTTFDKGHTETAGHHHAYRLVWIGSFPLCVAVMFALQPDIHVAVAMAAVASMLMAVFAAAACDPDHAPVRRNNVSVLSPVLAAVMIWLALNIGHSIGGVSIFTASLASVVSLAGLYLADMLVSSVLLMAASRGRVASAAPVAVLIEGKFAGLFGRIL